MPIFGGGNELFRQMLGDIVKMMPGAGSKWLLAEQMATEIAGSGDDPGPDPITRIELEQLSGIAALHVNEIGGVPPPSGGGARLLPTSRRDWARRTLATWRPVLDRLSQALPDGGAVAGDGGGAPGDLGAGDGGGAPGDLGAGDGHAEADDAMGALLSQWATAMFPMMTAMQVGSVAGHLAERALGPYDVPLAPVPGDEIFVPSHNLEAIASDWTLPLSDLRLWLCVHELAYHAVLSRPAVAETLAALVVEHAERVRPDPEALGELLAGADPADPAALARIFGDPAALGASEDSPELKSVRSRLDALTAAIAGYGEHVTSVAAGRLIGTQAPIGEAMRRRRVGRGEGEKVAERLFGLSLDQAQIDRGERFVRGVLERSGDVELAHMWL
ncbi:MAG: zinc-dependent metalloprotease, partial [Acidimicrobiales bacterium]